MRLDRTTGLPLLLIVIHGSSWSPARGGDSAAEVALKEKGLSRAGHIFVIEDEEKPVLAKMKEVRSVFATYAAVVEQQAAIQEMIYQSAQMQQQRVALQSNINMLNKQIASMPNHNRGRYNSQTALNNPLIAERNMMNAAMAEVGQAQKALKSQTPEPKDQSALDADAKKKLEALKVALTDLRKDVDEVAKKYAELGAEESVKKAIDDMAKASKAKVTLGPSPAFLAGMKQLDQAERQLLGKRSPAASKKKSTTKAKKSLSAADAYGKTAPVIRV